MQHNVATHAPERSRSSLIDGLREAVSVHYSRKICFLILLILEISNAFELASMVLGDNDMPAGEIFADNFGEMEISALTEIANIIIGSYLSSLCTLTDMDIKPSVPVIAMDMLGAIMNIIAVQYGQIGDSVLLLSTRFSDMEKELAGNLFLVPDYESYKRLIKKLGLDT